MSAKPTWLTIGTTLYVYIYISHSIPGKLDHRGVQEGHGTHCGTQHLSTVQVALRGDGRHAEIGVAKDWESDEIYGEFWGFLRNYGELWGFMGNSGDLWGFMGIFEDLE